MILDIANMLIEYCAENPDEEVVKEVHEIETKLDMQHHDTCMFIAAIVFNIHTMLSTCKDFTRGLADFTGHILAHTIGDISRLIDCEFDHCVKPFNIPYHEKG